MKYTMQKQFVQYTSVPYDVPNRQDIAAFFQWNRQWRFLFNSRSDVTLMSYLPSLGVGASVVE